MHDPTVVFPVLSISFMDLKLLILLISSYFEYFIYIVYYIYNSVNHNYFVLLLLVSHCLSASLIQIIVFRLSPISSILSFIFDNHRISYSMYCLLYQGIKYLCFYDHNHNWEPCYYGCDVLVYVTTSLSLGAY